MKSIHRNAGVGDEKSEQKSVAAVDRAMAILSVFSLHDTQLELSEIARATGLYKSTILRLLGSLIASGMVIRGPDGRYMLGHESGRLGAVYRASSDPAERRRDILQELVGQTALTAGYFVAQGEFRYCMICVIPRVNVFHHLSEGERLPISQGAAGRLLCAYTGREVEDASLIREQRHLFRLGDRFPELASMAVPVIDRAGGFHGAVSLSGLASHFSPDNRSRILALMKTSARDFADQLQR